MTKQYKVCAYDGTDTMFTRIIDGGSIEDALFIALDSMKWKEITHATNTL